MHHIVTECNKILFAFYESIFSIHNKYEDKICRSVDSDLRVCLSEITPRIYNCAVGNNPIHPIDVVSFVQ